MASKSKAVEITAENAQEYAEDHGITFFFLVYTDIVGVLRGKLVPKSAIGTVAKEGGHFCRVMFRLAATDPDMIVIPDWRTFIQLPWKGEIGWVVCDLFSPAGVPFRECPRLALKSQIERLAKQNLTFKSGIEFELYLVNTNASQIADQLDERPAINSCFRADSLMRNSRFLTRVCQIIDDLGWEPYQIDHEGSSGQFEFNFTYADALTMADRHVFFKYLCRSIAEEEGMRVTFMPKPFADKLGSGCHMHLSVWKGDENVFLDEGGELGLSTYGYRFLAGVLANAKALCAILCPTVNSYKRLVAAGWCPNKISYTGDNRSHMLRIPNPGRFEIRLADGAVNPYLNQAAVIAAGMDGVVRDLNPGKRCDLDGGSGEPADAEMLPLNLLDAVRELKKNESMRKEIGVDCIDAFVTYKEGEWIDYMRHLSEWEKIHTMDC